MNWEKGITGFLTVFSSSYFQRLYGLVYIGVLIFLSVPIVIGASGIGPKTFWLILCLWDVLGILAILFLPSETLTWARRTGEWPFLIIGIVGMDVFAVLIRLSSTGQIKGV